MKIRALLALSAIVLLIALPAAEAQQRVNPNKLNTYFTHPLRTDLAYANSSGDTSAAFALGAVNKLSVLIVTTDSVALDFYVDYRLKGSPTWTQAYADSMLLYVDTLNVLEFVLKDGDHDSIDHNAVDLRFRTVHRAAGNGTTTAYRTQELIWKP